MSTVSKAFLQIFKYGTYKRCQICVVCQGTGDRHIMNCPEKYRQKGMIAMTDRCNCNCGFSVAVEYGFTPCYFNEQQLFDIEIRCSDGTPAAAGKAEGGSSAYFTLPCEGVYSVTVSGPPCFSPRSQTKRVQCRRDNANGATFIFNKLQPVYPPHPPKPEPPCRPEPPCSRPEPPCSRPEPPCSKPESSCDCPDKPCRHEKPIRQLNIRCSRNGITIE